MTESEVRVTSSTGGQKGRKLARYGLIPANALRQVAEVYGRGALKYTDDNWRKGYDWSLSFEAMQRHLWQFWGGEDIDDGDGGTGAPHLACAAFHVLTLLEFMAIHRSFDDRPSSDLKQPVPEDDSPSSTHGPFVWTGPVNLSMVPDTGLQPKPWTCDDCGRGLGEVCVKPNTEVWNTRPSTDDSAPSSQLTYVWHVQDGKTLYWCCSDHGYTKSGYTPKQLRAASDFFRLADIYVDPDSFHVSPILEDSDR